MSRPTRSPEHVFVASVLTALLLSCSDDRAAEVRSDTGIDQSTAQSDAASACVPRLFGTPGPRTGLGADVCGPSCSCPDAFEAFDVSTLDTTRLASLTWSNSPAPLAEDPYRRDAPKVPDNSVCGIKVDGVAYTTATYDSAQAAQADGAVVTHMGVCGQCSSLEDFLVYANTPDLTTPVRQCGILGITQGDEANVECLKNLGFSDGCAQIWFYNTRHTRQNCQDICLELLSAPFHNADGSLNACLQCDEDESGAVFKAYAGRTRRNTGLASAICRPCDEVTSLPHDY